MHHEEWMIASGIRRAGSGVSQLMLSGEIDPGLRRGGISLVGSAGLERLKFSINPKEMGGTVPDYDELGAMTLLNSPVRVRSAMWSRS